jgi:hypothetical protein
MADMKPLIEKEELKKDFFERCLSDRPHELYIVYDELMDELILKLVPPETLTTVYYLDDNVAFLVDLESLEIVGLQLFNFQEEYLPRNEKFQKEWYELNMAEELGEYQLIEYKPKRMNYLGTLKKRRERKEAELLVDIYCKNSREMANAIA